MPLFNLQQNRPSSCFKMVIKHAFIYCDVIVRCYQYVCILLANGTQPNRPVGNNGGHYPSPGANYPPHASSIGHITANSFNVGGCAYASRKKSIDKPPPPPPKRSETTQLSTKWVWNRPHINKWWKNSKSTLPFSKEEAILSLVDYLM